MLSIIGSIVLLAILVGYAAVSDEVHEALKQRLKLDGDVSAPVGFSKYLRVFLS